MQSGWHPLGNELLPDVIVDRKGRFRLRQRHSFFQRMEQRIVQGFRRLGRRSCLGCRNIAEHQLGQLVRIPIAPDLHDVLHTLVDLGSGFIRQQLVDDSLVQRQLAAIVCVG